MMLSDLQPSNPQELPKPMHGSIEDVRETDSAKPRELVDDLQTIRIVVDQFLQPFALR